MYYKTMAYYLDGSKSPILIRVNEIIMVRKSRLPTRHAIKVFYENGLEDMFEMYGENQCDHFIECYLELMDPQYEAGVYSYTSPADKGDQVPDDVLDEIYANRKISAIKALRNHFPIDLKTAKHAVEAIMDDLDRGRKPRLPIM